MGSAALGSHSIHPPARLELEAGEHAPVLDKIDVAPIAKRRGHLGDPLCLKRTNLVRLNLPLAVEGDCQHAVGFVAGAELLKALKLGGPLSRINLAVVVLVNSLKTDGGAVLRRLRAIGTMEDPQRRQLIATDQLVPILVMIGN